MSDILEDLIREVRSKDGQRDWMSHDVYFLRAVLTNVVISKNAVYAVKGMDTLSYSNEVNDSKSKGDQRRRRLPLRDLRDKGAGVVDIGKYHTGSRISVF